MFFLYASSYPYVLLTQPEAPFLAERVGGRKELAVPAGCLAKWRGGEREGTVGVKCLSPPPIETSHHLPVPPGQLFPVTILRGTPECVLVVGEHGCSPYGGPQL